MRLMPSHQFAERRGILTGYRARNEFIVLQRGQCFNARSVFVREPVQNQISDANTERECRSCQETA